MGRTVELRIAGQNYRVVSSASAEQLEHLAGVVNRKMAELAPQPRADGAQRLLLVALALAHDVEEERDHREALLNRTREFLGGLLGRVESALSDAPVGPEGGGVRETPREGDREASALGQGPEDHRAGGGVAQDLSGEVADSGEERFT